MLTDIQSGYFWHPLLRSSHNTVTAQSSAIVIHFNLHVLVDRLQLSWPLFNIAVTRVLSIITLRMLALLQTYVAQPVQLSAFITLPTSPIYLNTISSCRPMCPGPKSLFPNERIPCIAGARRFHLSQCPQ